MGEFPKDTKIGHCAYRIECVGSCASKMGLLRGRKVRATRNDGLVLTPIKLACDW